MKQLNQVPAFLLEREKIAGKNYDKILSSNRLNINIR